MDRTNQPVRRGLIDGLTFPSLVIGGSMAGFGSLARDSDIPLSAAVAISVGMFGLPGQVAFVEMYVNGAEAIALIVASSMGNARFLPMALSFLPLLRPGLKRQAWSFALVQLLSTTSWAAAMRVLPDYDVRQLLRYFVAFGCLGLAAAAVGTTIGFLGTELMPRPVALGMIFLNPIYIGLLLIGTKNKQTLLAILTGVAAGPPLHLISPDWGVLAAGLIAGTATFWVTRR